MTSSLGSPQSLVNGKNSMLLIRLGSSYSSKGSTMTKMKLEQMFVWTIRAEGLGRVVFTRSKLRPPKVNQKALI